MATEAPERVSVPHPFHVPTSYTGAQSPASGDPESPAHFSDQSGPAWMTHDRACAALVRAARRAKGPLAADQLAALAGIGHILGARARDAILAELAASGDLIKETRQNPRALWERVELFSAPRG
jgi:hypothetical protein